jgi:hypothetical protein
MYDARIFANRIDVKSTVENVVEFIEFIEFKFKFMFKFVEFIESIRPVGDRSMIGN